MITGLECCLISLQIVVSKTNSSPVFSPKLISSFVRQVIHWVSVTRATAENLIPVVWQMIFKMEGTAVIWVMLKMSFCSGCGRLFVIYLWLVDKSNNYLTIFSSK